MEKNKKKKIEPGPKALCSAHRQTLRASPPPAVPPPCSAATVPPGGTRRSVTSCAQPTPSSHPRVDPTCQVYLLLPRRNKTCRSSRRKNRPRPPDQNGLHPQLGRPNRSVGADWWTPHGGCTVVLHHGGCAVMPERGGRENHAIC
jgi:hypothetical protein